MTKKLYWETPYQKEFDAIVDRIDANKVILNQTCFYPKGGGQVGDTGELNGIRVVDTIKNDADEVIHILEKDPGLRPGDMVHGKIDWKRRHKIMKLHSAAHIVYNFMQQVYPGVKVASSGIVDDRKDKQDYMFPGGGEWDKEKLSIVEKYANDFIAANKEIKNWTDANGIRHWFVEGTPEMKCGGTHVHNTSEIGRIAIKRGKKPGAGKERIEISLAE
jgi:alanyl-tRNA synthetase